MRFQKCPEDNGLPVSGAHRSALKAALDRLASPAFRLHRYRSAHARLLQSAWCQIDRPDTRCDT